MSVWKQVTRLIGRLTQAFDQQIADLPGVGSLFVSKWNIIQGDLVDGFVRVNQEGIAKIPHQILPKDIKGRNCLRLGTNMGQIRNIYLPEAAAIDPVSAIALHLDTLSPLPAEDTLFAVQRIDPAENGQIKIEVALASKTRTKTLLDNARDLGLPISAVDIHHPDRALDDPAIDLVKGQPARATINPTQILVAICAVFLTVAVALQFWAMWGLEPQAVQLAAKTRPAGFSIARAQKTDRMTRLSVIETWDAVTISLPDSAWADHLTIDKNQLRLAGNASNAAALVSVLEANPAFSGVRLAAASVQEEDGRESFDLLASISKAEEPS